MNSLIAPALDPADLETISAQFRTLGWARVRMVGTNELQRAQNSLLQLLRKELGPLDELTTYHQHCPNDAEHQRLQQLITEHYWEQGFGTAIIREQLPFFSRFIGPDLHVQKYPYLRVARPGRPGDNIGVHRDTHHGASPYEISAFVPFVDLPQGMAFSLIPGSHLEAESAYPYEQVVDPVVTRGSPRHKLGFPYAPKVLRDEAIARLEPIPMNAGDMLLMSLSIVHGQVQNSGNGTRFSSDIRVVNSLAPIEWQRGVRSDYYIGLSMSAVTAQARMYFTANPDDAPKQAP
jgi:hypothetical protein